MKIRLRHNLPIAPEHGMMGGRVFEVLTDDYDNLRCSHKPKSKRVGWAWVIGDAGEEVKVLGHEYEIVEAERLAH